MGSKRHPRREPKGGDRRDHQPPDRAVDEANGRRTDRSTSWQINTVFQRSLTFLIAWRLIQDRQHAANQQIKSITSGKSVQHADHLRDLRRIHRAAP
jgi:hypothetical protein